MDAVRHKPSQPAVAVMTVAQHERIVGELRAEIAEWQEAAGRSRSDVVAYIAERAKLLEERDAALARVAELEGKLTDWVHEGFRLNEALAVAKAQHSVPEGWKLVPVEPTEDVLEAIHNGGYVGDDQELRWFYQSILAAAPAPGGE
ncbi:hypothetical protein M003_29840 [Pseudomonas aeruginosa IGB83]|nr:hypothetical protein M003_29840 [Pseudomonas aeruginosa IGB83]